jgi:hypothetical protein
MRAVDGATESVSNEFGAIQLEGGGASLPPQPVEQDCLRTGLMRECRLTGERKVSSVRERKLVEGIGGRGGGGWFRHPPPSCSDRLTLT